jgi:hypothetical protein
LATNPRTTISERAQLRVVNPGRRIKQRRSSSLKSRLVSTAIALAVLALLLRYLPSETRKAQARTSPRVVQEAPADLHFSGVQINRAPGGDALYVDGMVTNAGKGRVSAATAQVDFYDGRGTLVASVQSPLVGVARGGTDLVGNEFVRNPIGPGEMRFFRVAVQNVPPDWNHEPPALKPVAVTAR